MSGAVGVMLSVSTRGPAAKDAKRLENVFKEELKEIAPQQNPRDEKLAARRYSFTGSDVERKSSWPKPARCPLLESTLRTRSGFQSETPWAKI